MKSTSERSQGLVEIVLIISLVFIGAFTVMAMSGNLHGMKRGADTIGNAAGNAIDDAIRQQQEQDIRDIDWQVANGTAVSAWVNT